MEYKVLTKQNIHQHINSCNRLLSTIMMKILKVLQRTGQNPWFHRASAWDSLPLITPASFTTVLAESQSLYFWFSLLLTQKYLGGNRGLLKVFGFLPSHVWETKEFQTPSFTWSIPGCCGHFGNKPMDRRSVCAERECTCTCTSLSLCHSAFQVHEEKQKT